MTVHQLLAVRDEVFVSTAGLLAKKNCYLLVKGRADTWALFTDAFTFANNAYRPSKADKALLCYYPVPVFDQVMKNILFCFSIALIILLPASAAAINCTPAGEVKMTNAKHSGFNRQVNTITHYFDDTLLDAAADDELNESERKKTNFVKVSGNTTSFAASIFCNSCHKIIFDDTSFVSLRISLFIFISQFRL